MIRPRLVLLCALLSLSGCLNSVLPKSGVRAVYAMDEVNGDAPCAQTRLQLGVLVETPRTLAPFDGVELLYRHEDGELQILPGARWAAPAPVLLQDLLAQTLEAGCVAPVVAQASAAYALPLRLSSELRTLSIQREGDQIQARLSASMRLSCVSGASVIASRSFTVNVAGNTTPAAAAAGLRDAARQWAGEVRDWLSGLPTLQCG